VVRKNECRQFGPRKAGDVTLCAAACHVSFNAISRRRVFHCDYAQPSLRLIKGIEMSARSVSYGCIDVINLVTNESITNRQPTEFKSTVSQDSFFYSRVSVIRATRRLSFLLEIDERAR